jgi:hypothetical protein
MSRRIPFLLTCVAGLLLCSAERASAQQPYYPKVPSYGPGYRPMLNPSLNLLRGGNSAVNYYLGAIPEIDRRANARLFSSSIYDLEQRYQNISAPNPDADLLTPPNQTGHPTAFGTTAGYFPQTRFGGLSGGAPVGGSARRGR